MNSLTNNLNLTVLIVDDNPLELGLIRLILNKNFPGIKCIALTKVPEWRSFLQSQKVDVVIIDYRLPEKNGLEHINDLRQIDKDIYAFLITALEKDEIDQDITQSGATDLIVKDRSYSNLIYKLNNVILKESTKRTEEQLILMRTLLSNFTKLVVLQIDENNECVDVFGNTDKFYNQTGINNLKLNWKIYFLDLYNKLKNDIVFSNENLVSLKNFNLILESSSILLNMHILKLNKFNYLVIEFD